jgi:hypothetical protein
MKMKTLLTIVTAIAMGLTVNAADDDTPLGKQMSTMNRSLRSLKRNIADPAKKQDNLDALKKINAALAEAIKLEPKKTTEQTDKAAYVAKYKEQMEALTKSFAELEAAVKADKVEDAQKLFEKLSEQKEKGHKDFGVDD